MMHIALLILIYILVCYLVALSGSNRKFGFWGYLFFSLFMTPILGLLCVMGSDNQKKL